MKVLVCIPCLLTGGTEIQTLSLVEALAAAGHSVVVACYFEHSPLMVSNYRRAGATVELMSEKGARPSGIRDTLTFLWKGLRRIVRKHRPNVAHVQYMAPGALPIIVLRALGIKKIIATAHTSADIYPSLKQIHWLNKRVLTAFQCITLKAETSFFGSASLFDTETSLKKHGNHFTIYNNLPSYISLADTPRTKRPKTIGVVSRLEHIKGMDLVVPAFAQIRACHPEMRLLVVGDGSQRGLMEKQCKDFRLPEESVEFTGRKPQAELQDCYDRIDILLMPSRSEGFGLTAIEAMARGCVPVVANIGGLPEVICDGKSGLVHSPKSIGDIADKTASIIESPGLYPSLSAGAIDRANDFSKKQYWLLIAYLYTNLQ